MFGCECGISYCELPFGTVGGEGESGGLCGDCGVDLGQLCAEFVLWVWV